jgi:hypothetical protein
MVKRKSSDAKILRRLIRKRGEICEYCGVGVKQISSIPLPNRLHQEAFYIHYKNRFGTHRVAIATLEHVQRLADGGTYEKHNLLVACAACNDKRAKECASREKVLKPCCRHCHREFGEDCDRHRTSRACSECHTRLSKPFKKEPGGNPLGSFLKDALSRQKDAE